MTFANVESCVSEIYLFSARQLRALARPRILKSHDILNPDTSEGFIWSAIPETWQLRSITAASREENVPDVYSTEEFVPRFLNAEFFDYCGSWKEHVLSWNATRKDKSGFLFIKYEDLLAQPLQELSKIASALQIARTPEELACAVELSSAGQMRNMEKQQSAEWKLTKGTRQDLPSSVTRSRGVAKQALAGVCADD